MDMTHVEALQIEAATQFAKANKKRIAKEFTDPAVYIPDKEPVSVYMAGCAGAGKTEAAIEMIEALANGSNTKTMRIDPDDLRHHFDGYIGTNSWMFQLPSSILVDRIHDLALDQSQSFVLDGTLCNVGKAEQNIARSLRRGRKCIVMFVYQRPELAWRFVQAREAREGRRIPPEVFVEQFFTARDVVNHLKRKFGKDLTLNVLIKNTDASSHEFLGDVERIEDHLHEGYDREGLLRLIKGCML